MLKNLSVFSFKMPFRAGFIVFEIFFLDEDVSSRAYTPALKRVFYWFNKRSTNSRPDLSRTLIWASITSRYFSVLQSLLSTLSLIFMLMEYIYIPPHAQSFAKDLLTLEASLIMYNTDMHMYSRQLLFLFPLFSMRKY